MGRKSTRNTRGRIISAAWKLFYQQGYEDTTVEDIVFESQTSKGSFYHYFDGKDALLGTLAYVFDEKYEELMLTMDPKMNAMDTVSYTHLDVYKRQELEKFTRSNEAFKTSKRQFHKAMGRFNATMEFFLCILSAVVIAVGGWLSMGGKMNYIDLITFNLYITAFINPVRKLSNFAEMFANGFAGLQRFTELMRTEPEMQDAPDAKTLERVSGRIDLDHVSFAYREDAAVLHDIDLHIRPGETVAVVGPSGGGKSTLCQLIPQMCIRDRNRAPHIWGIYAYS